MASTEHVRQYLAHWFQLGRQVFGKHDQAWCPQPVIVGDRYSSAFETCWKDILNQDGKDCYLEGTEQSIDELLSGTWELLACSRCPLLVPVRINGVQTGTCPCSELPSWPNLDVPTPRLPVNSRAHLGQICDRVQAAPHSRSSSTHQYPLPQSIALQTAIELQLAKARGDEPAEADCRLKDICDRLPLSQ